MPVECVFFFFLHYNLLYEKNDRFEKWMQTNNIKDACFFIMKKMLNFIHVILFEKNKLYYFELFKKEYFKKCSFFIFSDRLILKG